MGLLRRAIFREIALSALLGSTLFTFVLFLQQADRKLFEVLIRSSASWQTIAYLFALVLPPTLAFTIPLGVLVGILIGLSRMAGDGEITAMRASGIAGRHVIPPVILFALMATLITGAATLWLTPLSIWRTYKTLNALGAAQLTAQVQPRVFEEQFSNSNTILYVGDIVPGAGPLYRWRNVFLADASPPDKRNKDGRERGDAPRVTLASEAIAVPDVVHNRIQMAMLNGSTYEVGKNIADYFSTTFPRGSQTLEAAKPDEVRPRAFIEMDTGPLYRTAYRDTTLDETKRTEARIELHQRLALPPACLLLALIGIPLGVFSRKGGKSAAFILTVVLAFLYYMGLISMIGLARQRTLPVGLAVWIPNLAFALIGLFLISRLELPGDRDLVGMVRGLFASVWTSLRGRLPSPPEKRSGGARGLALLPQVIDTYVLTTFLFYFAMLLVTFVLLTHVYTFFELLSDMIKHRTPMPRFLEYLYYLTPKLIYDFTPISVLVAVLITFGVLTKGNEVTAFKACGVSLYRLAVPVLFTSLLLSVGLFAFDHYYVPHANRIQDGIRAEIKGRPVQTYLHPERPSWISGQHSRFYNYKYFDQTADAMLGVNVFEVDPLSFRLVRQIAAEKAHWEPSLNTWVFENGWSRQFSASPRDRFQDFTGRATTFPELDEPPRYFRKEVMQEKQMNYQQLASYIRELKQSGFATVGLQVQFYKKFSVPLFALIMALISIPFAFVVGARGAMAGVGVSFGIAITYWAISKLFEQIGNANTLPAVLAAWSPDALFSLAGLYFFTRMKT